MSKLIIDLPHYDPATDRSVRGVDLFFEGDPALPLEDVIDFKALPDGTLEVQRLDWTRDVIFETYAVGAYEVRNGVIRQDHNTYEDWN